VPGRGGLAYAHGRERRPKHMTPKKTKHKRNPKGFSPRAQNHEAGEFRGHGVFG